MFLNKTGRAIKKEVKLIPLLISFAIGVVSNSGLPPYSTDQDEKMAHLLNE